MGRKGENIRKRKDGRWEARIVTGHDLSSKVKYHSIYGKTYQEAKNKRNEWLIEQAAKEKSLCQDHSFNPKITVAQFMQEWLEEQRHSVKQSSHAHYVYLLEKHVLPDIGSYYLAAVTNSMLDNFLKNKMISGRLDGKGGLSAKTVTDIRSVLQSSMSYAAQYGYPCQVNGKLYHPKTKQPRTRVLTQEEQAKLEYFLFGHPDPLELGILTALYSGLRIGEICALRWGDFNFENGTIFVNKTLIRIQDLSKERMAKTKILIDRPKTDSSVRIVPLPSAILRFLKNFQKDENIYLLTGTTMWMEPRLCLDKYKCILMQAGLETRTFHTLRHTFATRCVETGFDPKSLSEILGHANVNTTLQRYVHPSIDQKKAQMERLGNFSVQGQNMGQREAEISILC